jgi:ribonuclease HII
MVFRRGGELADFRIEREMIARGFSAVAGVDEAGRGALFGPVVAAAVMFPLRIILGRTQDWIGEIDDSKRLSPRKREKLARLLLMRAESVGIGVSTCREVDENNVLKASHKAMRRSVESMSVCPDFLLVDGFDLNDVNYPQRSLCHGDRKCISIAAASILAKVLRDRMISQLDRIFDGYALKKNKGYGTREHFDALRNKGPTIFHRLTFNLMSEEKK